MTARVLPPLTLILGGARSGKSSYAEALLTALPKPWAYIATAEAFDDEMRQRINHHQARRGAGWVQYETPLDIAATLSGDAAGQPCLVDCLTLWLSNLMHASRDVESETEMLAEWLRDARHPVLLVSNEVGLGLVPETPLGRDFRDAQGRLNQAIAAAVPNVVFVAAGLPLWLKRESIEGAS